MNTQQRGIRRLASALGALMLAGATVLALAVPAQAVGPNLPQRPEDGGSLTIHKLVSPASDPELPNNGGEISPEPSLPKLGGVTFKVTALDIDLATNEGWEQAKALSEAVTAAGNATPAAGMLGSVAGTITTEDDESSADYGTATLDGLWGAYLVEETGGGTNVVTRAAPFIVTVPLPTTVAVGEGSQQSWLTDVHVYPKNGVSVAEKTVDETGAYGLGDTVSWTITGLIPNTTGTDPVTSFTLTDSLDPRLSFDESSVVAKILPATFGPEVPLTVGDDPGDDLGVSAISQASAEGPRTALTFALKTPGLATASLYPSGVFSVTFETTVAGVGDGTIMNTALANINGESVESEPVDTQWGVLDLFKFDAATAGGEPGERVGLEGAEFQIFLNPTPVDGEEPVAVSGQDTFTSGPDGHVLVVGLRAGVTYYVEETKAPDRYMPKQGRTEVLITATTTVPEECEPVEGQEPCEPVLVPVQLDIANTKIPDWQLPLTGGTAMMAPALGIGLILVAAGTLLVSARRRGARTE